MIDVAKIIQDTEAVFNASYAQQAKFMSLTSISSDEYYKLHTSPLVATTIKIDVDLFLKDIEQYQQDFYQWGTQHTHLPRYGLALVNQDGILKPQDPINGSLYEWNSKHPENPIFETDCCTLTPVMSLPSLQPIRVFDGVWTRSNILKWQRSAEFKPHIDTAMPSHWIRLWGCTHPSSIELHFYNDQGEQTVMQNLEAGRLYVIDTRLVHDAICTGDECYQFFLSISATGLDRCKELIL